MCKTNNPKILGSPKIVGRYSSSCRRYHRKILFAQLVMISIVIICYDYFKTIPMNEYSPPMFGRGSKQYSRNLLSRNQTANDTRKLIVLPEGLVLGQLGDNYDTVSSQDYSEYNYTTVHVDFENPECLEVDPERQKSPPKRKYLSEGIHGQTSARCYTFADSGMRKEKKPKTIDVTESYCDVRNVCMKGERFYGVGLSADDFISFRVVRMGSHSACTWRLAGAFDPKAQATETRVYGKPVIFVMNPNNFNHLSTITTVIGIYDALDQIGIVPINDDTKSGPKVTIMLMQDEKDMQVHGRELLHEFFDPQRFDIDYIGDWASNEQFTCFPQAVMGNGGVYLPFIQTRKNRTIAYTSQMFPVAHKRLQHIIPRIVSDFDNRHGGASSTPCSLLIVQRKGHRLIVNVDEMSVFFKASGFNVTVVEFEDMNLKSQLDLIRKSEVVVGMHGAGLANMLVAPNSTLIELHTYRESKETYSALLSYTQGEYFPWYNQIGNNSIPNDHSELQKEVHRYWKHRDTVVDLDSFQQVTWAPFLKHRYKMSRRTCVR